MHSKLTVISINPEESWCILLTDTQTFAWNVPLLQIVPSSGSGAAGQESSRSRIAAVAGHSLFSECKNIPNRCRR